jgi:hypothetical protein
MLPAPGPFKSVARSFRPDVTSDDLSSSSLRPQWRAESADHSHRIYLYAPADRMNREQAWLRSIFFLLRTVACMLAAKACMDLWCVRQPCNTAGTSDGWTSRLTAIDTIWDACFCSRPDPVHASSFSLSSACWTLAHDWEQLLQPCACMPNVACVLANWPFAWEEFRHYLAR